jgi:uncharacterized membrane protein YczE
VRAVDPLLPPVTGPVRVRQVMPRLLVGLTMCSTGIAMMLRADLGLGPWDVLHQGLARTVGMSIGVVSILVGFLVLMLWLPLRQRPGLGTVMNWIWIGFSLDVILTVMPSPEAVLTRWILLVTAPVLFALGVAVYIGAGVGAGPRDGVMTGLELRGVPIALARTALELTVLAIGWLLGGTVGVGTVYFSLIVGPVMHLSMPRLRAPWFPPGAQPRVFGGTPR